MNLTKINRPCLSRRAALKAGAFALLASSLLPAPANALALPSDADLRYASFLSGATPEELWELAVSQAEAQNGKVFLNEAPQAFPRSITSTREVSGRADTTITVAGQPEVVQAIAVYSVSDEDRIIGLNDAWLSCTASQVGHTYVSHAFLDSNRTLAINYTATITNYIDFSQVLTVYAEFGILGGRFANASWLE